MSTPNRTCGSILV